MRSQHSSLAQPHFPKATGGPWDAAVGSKARPKSAAGGGSGDLG